MQRLVRACIVGGELSARRAQQGALGQQRMPARIGVDNASTCIDEEHAGADAVEGVGESCGLGGLQVDHPADQHGAADVWNDEAHAPAHLVVDPTIPLVPEDTRARRRSSPTCRAQHSRRRSGPAAVPIPDKRVPAEEFVIGNDVRDSDGFADLGKDVTQSSAGELNVFFDNELLVVRIDTGVIRDAAAFAGCIPGKECCC